MTEKWESPILVIRTGYYEARLLKRGSFSEIYYQYLADYRAERNRESL